MNVMRFTVVDLHGTVSFVYDCEVLPALLAACADGARTLSDLLDSTAREYPALRDYVSSGMAVFDEHNVGTNLNAIHQALRFFEPHEAPVFRVMDDVTRQTSLQPTQAGLIMFNLLHRRIVQVQNSYAEIRNMVHRVRRLQRAGWRILP